MDLATLRTELQATLTTLNLLGTYTLANGMTTPAISSRRDGERMFPGTKVAGLECVILAEPRLVPISQYSQQEALREWSVFLVGWNTAANPTAAAEAIVWAFPGSEWERIPVPQGVGPSNQARVIIRQQASSAEPVNLQLDGGLPKSFTIPDPSLWVGGDGFGIARMAQQTTLAAVYAVVQGTGSPSVTFELRHAADRSAAGTLATVNTAVTSTTTGQSIPLGVMPIPEGNFLWCEITATSGAPTRFEVTLET